MSKSKHSEAQMIEALKLVEAGRISDEGRENRMPKSRHTEAQMVAALQQVDAGRSATDVGREVGVSAATI